MSASSSSPVSVRCGNLDQSEDSYYTTSFISSGTSDETVDLDGQLGSPPTIVLPGRPAFTKEAFDVNYQLIPLQKKCLAEELKQMKRSNCINPNCMWDLVRARFPVLVWLPQYEWKDDFFRDFIAGITTAVMHISLGMAFATLALMPPITGLYIAFFANLIYSFVGGCHHLSLCGTALISIMIGEVVERLLHPVGTQPSSDYENVDAITIATSITVVCGILQLVTGFLRLGGLAVYLSDTMLSGFLCGSAAHVFTSQLATIFGVKIAQVSSPLKVFKIIGKVAVKLPLANVATVVISFATLIFLLSAKYLSNKYLKVIPFPIPLELFVILLGTLISYYMDLDGAYKVSIVGFIPTGLPDPSVPNFNIVPNILLDCFIICIVSYTVTLSFGLVFAKKYKYQIHSNQELFALGVINMFGSFFQCVPVGVGMSRTLTQEAAGGRKLMTNFVAAILLLFAILFIGPVFRCLPSCILSTIAVIALKGMVAQVRTLLITWSISLLETSIWIVAFLAVVLLDVGIGLAIGFLYSLMVIVVRTQWPYTCLLGRVPETDMYLDINKYQTAKEIPGILIYHFASFLYFINKSYFKSELNRYVDNYSSGCSNADSPFWTNTQLKSNDLLLKSAKDGLGYGTITRKVDDEAVQLIVAQPSNSRHVPLHHIIVDASGWSYIDIPGMEVLQEVVEDNREKGITIFIAGCQAQVSEKLEKSEFYRSGSKHLVFPSIHDAMAYAESMYYESENADR